VHTFSLGCHAHARPPRWAKQLSVPDVAALIRDFVDHALTGTAANPTANTALPQQTTTTTAGQSAAGCGTRNR